MIVLPLVVRNNYLIHYNKKIFKVVSFNLKLWEIGRNKTGITNKTTT